MAVALERSATLSALAPETRCLYDIYKKEGDELYCKRRYKKALLSYNEAIYQKAQIHYRQGNYEMALLTFNRGHKQNSSAPGFLEGMQKAQHAMDIMTTGRHMKTTAVGDLSLYLPKKQSSFQVSKKSLPALPALKGKDQRVPSPGFRKRTGTLLLQVQKRRPPYMEQPQFGKGDIGNTKVNHKAMREILGQLYDDKAYFERILNSAGGQRDLSEMLSSVLEDGLKFLYDRVLFWAQSGRLPPAPPQPTNIQAIQWPITRVEEESSNEDTEEDEESDEEMSKVNEAIDAVSSVNGPHSTTKRKRLKIRKRRADILKKRASVIVIPKKKPKKIHFRKVEEPDPEEEQKDVSKINFRFKSLTAVSGSSHPDTRLDLGADGRSDRGTTTVDESEADNDLVAIDDLEEKRRQKEERRKQRRERREKRREEERQRQIKEEEEEAKEQATPKEDPLIEYLNKMMDSLEDLFQKSEYGNLKTKAESFLLTMEKYDKNVTEHKMSYVAKAHSYLGNAYIGLRNTDFAMMHHDKDLEIGERWKLPECVSRALGNIGRVHISRKKYDQALKYLAQKTKMPSSPRETAWLYHEIASCFLQLHHYQFAKDAASKSLEAASHSNDSLYQLQTSVLLGAIEVKLQKFEKAYGSFERAMDQARLRDDKKAQQAIAEALQEVNERIVREARRKKEQQEAAKLSTVATTLPENQKQTNGNNEEGSNVSVSESARDTGEDPELTDLVADDDTASEGTGDGKEKSGDPEKGKEKSGDPEKGNERSGDPEKEGDVAEKEQKLTSEEKTTDEAASDAKQEEVTETEKDNKTENEKEEKPKEGEENGEDTNATETTQDKENGNDTSGKEATAGANDEEKEATDKGEKGEEGDTTNDKEASEKNEACGESQGAGGENEKVDEAPKASDPETKQEIQAETKDGKAFAENKAEEVVNDTSEESGNAESEEKGENSEITKDDKAEEAHPTNEQEKGEKSDNVGEEVQNEVTSKESDENVKDRTSEKQEVVTVVVTDTENPKETSEENKEDRNAPTDNAGKSVGSPEATYKAVPITQELLTKNLAQDRGTKENIRKSVISIHESVRESESRRSSAKVPTRWKLRRLWRDIQSSTKKSVTIGGEQEICDGDQKEGKIAAVKTEAEEEKEQPEHTEPRGKDPIADRMEDDLAHMETDYAQKNFDQLLKRGNDLMRALKKVRNIDGWSKRRLCNFAKVHSFMGSASSEKQSFDKARMHHNADLKIGEVVGNTKIQSRALEHLGRTYIFESKHEKALEFFARRAHLPRTTEDTARLFHEIANCFFQLKAYEFAKDSAMVSMKAANEGNHTMFQLQSAVLIGVTKVKLQRTDAAFETFEEALKYAAIRDDPQAAEAIRQAMRQIEAKVAMKVKDQWMKKVKSSKEGTKDEGVEEEKDRQSQNPEKDNQSRTGAESDSNVYSLLNSMTEEEKPADDADATSTNADTTQEGKEDAKDGAENMDTNRTDKSGFLLAPDGPIDKKQNANRIVKVEKETGNTSKQRSKQTTKKVPKKSTTGSVAAVEKNKDNAKGSNPNANKASNAKTTASTNTKATVANSKTKDNTVTTTKKKQEAKDTVKEEAAVKVAVSNNPNGLDDPTADVASSEEPQNMKSAEQNKEPANNTAEADTSVNSESKGEEVTDPQSNQAEKDEKLPEGSPKEKEGDAESADNAEQKAVNNDTQEGNTDNRESESKFEENGENKRQDETHSEKDSVNTEQTNNHDTANENAQDKTEAETEETVNATASNSEDTQKVTVRPSPRKPKPKPQAAGEEKKPPMERRKSERFIGLDPKKVADFKNNKSSKAIPEEGPEKDQAAQKPKTERFVGLKPKKEKKPEKPTEDGSQQGTPKVDGVSAEDDAKTKEEEDGKKKMEIKPKSTNHGSKDENSPSPKKSKTSNHSPSKTEQADVTDPNDEDGYETNVPNAPMLTINDEVGFVRHDSIASRISATRPATRMSLADMVKSDPKGEEKDTTKSSKEELSALNALVKEAIKIDKKELRKAQEQSAMTPKHSPRKVSRVKTNSVASLNDYKLEEMRREAEIKRARRKRFLRNWKASFLLMLNSPYAEIPTTIQGRRLSTDFKHYRRNMSKANLSLAINEEGTYYQNFEDLERQRGYNKTSPRKSYSEKTSYSPDKGLKRKAGKERSVNEDDDEILGHIEDQLTSQDEAKPKRSKTSEEARIAANLAKAARDMRRRERDERREERKRLEEAERQRRVEEREEKDLLASMATKVSFSNPYDKTPTQIPKLEQRSSLIDDDEKKWMVHHERKLLRAKRREKREKELRRRHDEEKTKKKLENAASKSKAGSKTGSKESSPREPVEEDKEVRDQTLVGQDESTPEETPELYTPEESQPQVDDDSKEENVDQEDEQMEVEEKDEEEKKTEKADMAEKKETVAVPTQEKGEEKAVEKREEVKATEKKEEEKEREVTAKKEKEEKGEVTEKKEQEEEPVKGEEEKEEEGQKDEGEEADDDAEADDFDGYNDSEEDDDDLVAVYIEKEVRRMRADYDEDKIKEVTDRGNALLKALRKHTDIVSWSRRRLRWFAAAHSYMGSANVELKEFHKAQSHHQADYRIGEALEDTKIQSRALEHLARVSVLNKNTPKALEYLAKRAHLPRDTEQSARLFHEMANCFFTLGAVEYARDAAAESIEAAVEGNHGSYLLQSSLLLAVCSSRLKNYDSAEEQFKGALTHARRLNDKNTEEAIHAALREVESKRATMAKDKWKSKLKKGNENNEPKVEVKEA